MADKTQYVLCRLDRRDGTFSNGFYVFNDITTEGDHLFLKCKQECEDAMSYADSLCQRLWDDLHHRRETVIDINREMQSTSKACKEIRDEARSRCRAIRDHYRTEHVKLTMAINDLTY